MSRRRQPWWAAAALLAACAGPPAGEPGRGAADPPAAAAEAAPLGLGPGFVVWESNRAGRWRIWIRDLDGGPPRRLSPHERDRDHCCPHISPDGRLVAYLSFAAGGQEYPREGDVGALHLIAPDRSGDRVVAPVARSYWENRAVVWRSPRELVYIDGERATRLLELADGRERRLADPPPEHGWLIDPTLSWATSGLVQFSRYDRQRRAVVPQRVLGGCQPYFTGDGRWGFWAAGAGGPVDALSLEDGRTARVLDKSDLRAPDGLGYAYFPMFSSDGRLFAWAASTGRHDHFRADYEILLAESDPDTLQLVGAVHRVTHHQATDRFPDVWQPPLELGRLSGEAPFTARLEAPEAGGWEWSLGGGVTTSGDAAEHTWSEPGRWRISARRGDRELRGLVVVREARPPRALAAETRAGGGELVVRFDEEIEVAAARVSLASGREVAGLGLGGDGRSLTVRLAEPLAAADRLTVARVRDRAQRPNLSQAVTLEVAPPAWPVRRRGLAFLWQSADAANLVAVPRLGSERSYPLTARGEARLDAGFAMVIENGGSFVLERSEGAPILAALRSTNELSLEVTITPSDSRDGAIIASIGERDTNFWLAQQDGRIVFGLRTGRWHFPEVSPFALPVGRPSHLVLTYAPGRVTAYLDGELRLDSDEIQGGFFDWSDLPLYFGGGTWRGRIDGVAIYNRALSAAEAAESHRLNLARLAARPVIPRSVVEALLVRRSRTPTLAEISPYREALFTVRYRVERRLEGPAVAEELAAAQWVILDGRDLMVGRAAPEARYRLTLEPFAHQPQLESVFLGDTLENRPGELFYVVEAEPLDGRPSGAG